MLHVARAYACMDAFTYIIMLEWEWKGKGNGKGMEREWKGFSFDLGGLFELPISVCYLFVCLLCTRSHF